MSNRWRSPRGRNPQYYHSQGPPAPRQVQPFSFPIKEEKPDFPSYDIKPNNDDDDKLNKDISVKQENRTILDSYNSDLNLELRNDYVASPMIYKGFCQLWAGVRASKGVKHGKFLYEVKILDHLDVELPPIEPHPHVLRVGFSLDSCTLNLGEEPNSWGFGGTGRTSTNNKYDSYGKPYGRGDVVACFADMESDPIDISFSINGQTFGSAFQIPKVQLKGKALFPHILTKNTSFELNFGQNNQPYFKLAPKYEQFLFIDNISDIDKEDGAQPPPLGECEVLMMCGIPAAGKSTWAENYALKNPEKKFNIIGTNDIIDKMKVTGLRRNRNYAGRWDQLIKTSTECLNELLKKCPSLRRNFILDQTNVYPSAQRRKILPFKDFKRKAVVIVPSDEELFKRKVKREKEDGKDVPDSAVLEMKGNFEVPEVGELFHEVIFPELPKEEAIKLVQKYNEEGKQFKKTFNKRPRDDDRNRKSFNESQDKRPRTDQGPNFPQYKDQFSSDQFHQSNYGGRGRGSDRGRSFEDRPPIENFERYPIDKKDNWNQDSQRGFDDSYQKFPDRSRDGRFEDSNFSNRGGRSYDSGPERDRPPQGNYRPNDTQDYYSGSSYDSNFPAKNQSFSNDKPGNQPESRWNKSYDDQYNQSQSNFDGSQNQPYYKQEDFRSQNQSRFNTNESTQATQGFKQYNEQRNIPPNERSGNYEPFQHKRNDSNYSERQNYGSYQGNAPPAKDWPTNNQSTIDKEPYGYRSYQQRNSPDNRDSSQNYIQQRNSTESLNKSQNYGAPYQQQGPFPPNNDQQRKYESSTYYNSTQSYGSTPSSYQSFEPTNPQQSGSSSYSNQRPPYKGPESTTEYQGNWRSGNNFDGQRNPNNDNYGSRPSSNWSQSDYYSSPPFSGPRN